MRPLVLFLGFTSILLLIAQLTLGLLIHRGHSPRVVTSHFHTGVLTFVVVMAYLVLSMHTIASLPPRDKS